MESFTKTLFLFVLFALLLYSIFVVFPQRAFGDELTPRQKGYELCNRAVVKVEHVEIGESTDWTGSGVFFSETHLITNAHVVGELPESPELFRKIYSDEDLDRVFYWIVYNGKKYRASFVGRDPELDLAVLKTDNPIPGIVPATLGNSEETKKGTRVIACGNPLGIENTVTEGIISAKEKQIGLLSYESYIQTDAAINPGNSGGPLVSLEDGSVIGIVNSKLPRADNMGFAIPINLFKSIREELRGTIRRAWLGIGFPLDKLNDTEGFAGLLTIFNYTGINETVTLEKIQHELFENGGVLVTDIKRSFGRNEDHYDLPGQTTVPSDRKTPASRSDMRIADIIKKIGNHDIKTSTDLIYAIFRSVPSVETKILIARFSKTGEREEKELAITPMVRIPESARGKFY